MKKISPFSSFKFTGTLCAGLLLGLSASGQVPDSGPPAAAPGAPASPTQGSGGPPSAGKSSDSFLGKDVPSFDPGTEIFTWDGKNWNVNDNRLFQARFEKYLNAAEETGVDDRNYQLIISTILDKLAPGNATLDNVDAAFRLLPKASNYEIDARLCDSIADAVYSAWRSQDANERLARANDGLADERKKIEWNTQMEAGEHGLDSRPGGKNKSVNDQWAKNEQMKRDAGMAPYIQRLAEVNALLKANDLKKEVSAIQMKIEFQALIVQLFLQRRFQHVLMATRFYRAVFTDGDTALQVSKEAKDLFASSSGMPPTVGTLDAAANEVIRDAHEGVEAYTFLLQQNELESATKRLAESFVTGEYLPELRTLPREKKRKALEFTQKTDQLISAIDVKDYALAEKDVHELEATAKDFDNSKPMAAIETAKTVSAMHIAKAKNAAVSGDRTTLEEELKAATEIWPRNPALAEVSGMIFSQADVQQKALLDFDQLLSQHNYRQIYDDKIRFIAAAALDPTRRDQLKKVLDNMEVIEGAIIRATEIAKQGDSAGAWESVEKAFAQFPDDNKLNQVRADLTTEAADFVRTLRTAEQLEQKDQVGSSLAWYLKAQKIYPRSDYAQEGIDRLVKKILPET